MTVTFPRITAHLDSPNPPNPRYSFAPLSFVLIYSYKVFNRRHAPTKRPNGVKSSNKSRCVRGFNNIRSTNHHGRPNSCNSSSKESPVPKAAAHRMRGLRGWLGLNRRPTTPGRRSSPALSSPGAPAARQRSRIRSSQNKEWWKFENAVSPEPLELQPPTFTHSSV